MLAAALLPFLLAPQEPTTGTPAPRVVDAGALRLEIHPSRTAHLFHVVDQISGWDQYCHRQYTAAFAGDDGRLAPEDAAMLQRHAGVRRNRGWGQGLEQTFYVADDLEQALARGVAEGRLTADEAATERVVFGHFAARIDALRNTEQPRLDAFERRLEAERPRLRELADKLARFVGVPQVTVPVFLIANPSDRDFGGGFNGGRLTLEVPRASDAMPTFLHECLHALLNRKERELTRMAREAEPTLDWQTLNEGIAHALAPGLLVPEGASDPLLAEVTADIARGGTLHQGPVRFRRYALALRPLLRAALDDPEATIETFVPRAIDAWRVLKELDAATPARRR